MLVVGRRESPREPMPMARCMVSTSGKPEGAEPLSSARAATPRSPSPRNEPVIVVLGAREHRDAFRGNVTGGEP